MSEKLLTHKESENSDYEIFTFSLVYLRFVKLYVKYLKTRNSGVKNFIVEKNVVDFYPFVNVVIRLEYFDEGKLKTKLICVAICNSRSPPISEIWIQFFFNLFIKIKMILQPDNFPSTASKAQENETASRLMNFSNCKISDCELILYNILSLKIDYETDERLNITNKILGMKSANWLRLKYDAATKLQCEPNYNHFKTMFCENFRILDKCLNDDDEFIIKEMQSLFQSELRGLNSRFSERTSSSQQLLMEWECDKENLEFSQRLSFKMLCDFFKIAMKYHFRTSTCKALTEKSDLFRKFKKFFDLKSVYQETMDPTCSTGNPSASHVADETELYEETELDQSCCTSYLALQVAKETELHIATEQNHVERMKELIDRDRSLLNTRDRDGKTSLHVACEMDNTEAVECLLNYPDCLVDIADNCEKYALHYAAENGNVDNMKLLLNREAKVSEILNKLDVNGETALYLACKYGRTEAVELLLSHPRCLVNVGSEKLPLHCAAGNGYVEILKLLLEWDSTLLNKQDKDGETALHLACAVGNDEIVYSLLNFEGLDLNLTDKWGNTCFHTAALSKVCDILSALLSQKPDLQNKINKKGRTALHIAASIRNDTVIKYLLNLENCDVNVQDINGDTPLHLYVNAYKRTHFDIQNTDINVFKQKCSSLVDKGNKDGDTPLHKAVMVADHESVNKLIEMSANKDMKNNNGQTPVDLAYNLVDSFEKIPILSYFKIATNGDI